MIANVTVERSDEVCWDRCWDGNRTEINNSYKQEEEDKKVAHNRKLTTVDTTKTNTYAGGVLVEC